MKAEKLRADILAYLKNKFATAHIKSHMKASICVTENKALLNKLKKKYPSMYNIQYKRWYDIEVEMCKVDYYDDDDKCEDCLCIAKIERMILKNVHRCFVYDVLAQEFKIKCYEY